MRKAIILVLGVYLIVFAVGFQIGLARMLADPPPEGDPGYLYCDGITCTCPGGWHSHSQCCDWRYSHPVCWCSDCVAYCACVPY